MSILKRTIFPYLTAIYLAALACLIVLSSQNILQLLKDNKLLYSTSGQMIAASDFMHFYTCGKIAYSSDAQNLYKPEIQRQWHTKTLNGLPVRDLFYAQATPHFFCLFGLLTAWSPEEAFLVWSAISLTCGLAGIFLIFRQWTLPWQWVLAIMIGMLAMFPSMVNFRLGQVSWFLLGIASLYFVALYRRNDLIAGLALALLSVRPQYCLFFLIPAIVQRRWRLLAYFVAGGLALMMMTGSILGWQALINYPQVVLHAESTGQHFGLDAQKQLVSVRGLLNLILPTALSVKFGVALLFLCMAFSGWLWFKLDNKNQDVFSWLMSLTVLLALTSSPHTYSYDLTLLALTLATMPQLIKFDGIMDMPAHLRIWFFILISYPVLSWLVPLMTLVPAIAALTTAAPFALLALLNIVLTVIAAYHCLSAFTRRTKDSLQ